MTEPLRVLTRQDTPWRWGPDQERAFDNLKHSLSEHATLAYFQPNKQTEILVDGSPVGVAAMLTQESKVIAYTSRVLRDIKRRYSQTECEALAKVWACEH